MFHVEQSSKIVSSATIPFTTGNYICKLGSCSLIRLCVSHPRPSGASLGVLGRNPRFFAGAPVWFPSVSATKPAFYGFFGSFYDYFGAVSPVCPVAHRFGGILLPTQPPAHHTASPARHRSTDGQRCAVCARLAVRSAGSFPTRFRHSTEHGQFENSLPRGTSSVRALRCPSSQAARA